MRNRIKILGLVLLFILGAANYLFAQENPNPNIALCNNLDETIFKFEIQKIINDSCLSILTEEIKNTEVEIISFVFMLSSKSTDKFYIEHVMGYKLMPKVLTLLGNVMPGDIIIINNITLRTKASSWIKVGRIYRVY